MQHKCVASALIFAAVLRTLEACLLCDRTLQLHAVLVTARKFGTSFTQHPRVLKDSNQPHVIAMQPALAMCVPGCSAACGFAAASSPGFCCTDPDCSLASQTPNRIDCVAFGNTHTYIVRVSVGNRSGRDPGIQVETSSLSMASPRRLLLIVALAVCVLLSSTPVHAQSDPASLCHTS